MRPLFDITKINNYTRTDKLPFECEQCSNIFYMEKKWVYLRIIKKKKIKFCSTKCAGFSRITAIEINCKQCNVVFIKRLSGLSKSGNNFCSSSCSAHYNNAHKTTGTRRSKLEVWLEEQLTGYFIKLNIIYNTKEAINSELDIYIPSLNLAFELNGIFHYEPIYGKDKLASIQNNDNRKFQACLERGIELVIIDSSGLKKFQAQKGEKYFQIIKTIIENKILELSLEVEPAVSPQQNLSIGVLGGT